MSVESIITENLDVWTSAIKTKSASGRGSSKKLELYGIKKLRELILDLAVRGKLVQQDPNDEPTSKLIGRIKFEQDKLVEEQTIKRLKPLPPISNEEKTFQLPENWEWCRIGSLFNSIVSGGTPSKREPTYWNGDIPWASVKDLGNELFLSKTQDYITQKGLTAGSKLAEKGNLLICTRMGLGKIAIVDVPMAFNQDLKAVAVSKQIDLGFFINAFKTIKIEGTGTTVAGITQEQLTNYPIALPPYNEQVRIVAKIDALMALCDQLESQTEASIEAHQTLVKSLLGTLTNAKDSDELNESWLRISEHFDVLFTTEDSIDQLKQTILQLAVMGKLVKQDPNDEPASRLLERVSADKEQLIKDKKIKKQKPLAPIVESELPYELPSSWTWCRIGEVLETISDYHANGGYKILKENVELLDQKDFAIMLRTTNFSKKNYSEYKYITEKAYNFLDKSKLYPNDIIMNKIGDPGSTFYVDDRGQPMSLAMNLFLLRVSLANSKYIFKYLNANYDYVKSFANGTSTQTITKDAVNNLLCPLPPLVEQERIVAKIDEFFEICNSLYEQIAEAKSLQNRLAETISSSLVN